MPPTRSESITWAWIGLMQLFCMTWGSPAINFMTQTWKSLSQEGWFDSLFQKRTYVLTCFDNALGKNMIFLLKIIPARDPKQCGGCEDNV